ncbi:MAG: M60 family metallopeptidase [Butyricicoccus sp.]|nr:M60 family metallopeptidase [Butyricicoccus sp.]
MKAHKRIISAALSALTLFSLAPSVSTAPAHAASAAEDAQAHGSISATLRIDYAQSLGELRQRGVQAELLDSDGGLLLTAPLADAGSFVSDSGYSYEVSARNADGGELGSGKVPGCLDLTVSGLPQGDYELVFSGSGYLTYSQALTIEDFSQHVILGTGDGSFTLGDVNKDGEIDGKDCTALSRALASEATAEIDEYDLSGDGKIDIIDLAYITAAMSAGGNGGARVFTTELLPCAVDTEGLSESEARELLSLFSDGGGVRLESDDGGVMSLAIPLKKPVELEQLEMISPGTAAAPVRGTVALELDGGQTLELGFGTTPPEDVHATGSVYGSSVITIPLGRRVAVKKVTITVTETAAGGYAVLESVRFLQDIVPENPAAQNDTVRGLSAAEGDSRVSLRWAELPNVDGYRIEYWPSSNEQNRKTLTADTPRAEISGLDNLTEYSFTVTPVAGDWSGKPCEAVTARPRPASAPDMPDIVSVTALDGALRVSWKASKTATYYEIYCTDRANSPAAAYTQRGGKITGTSATVSGLENGRAYYLYVVAGNAMGKSAASRISTGTPVAVEYVRPEGIPTEGVLDSSLIADVRLAEPGNYLSSAYTADAPFTARNVIDGDYKTHWTAANWWSDEHVVCTFTEPVDLCSAVWVPRLDGEYPQNLRAYSVRVWRAGDDLSSPGTLIVPDPESGGQDDGGTGKDVYTWPNISNFSSAPTSRFGILPFGPVEDVIKISVAVEQRAYATVSLSELIFLTYDPERCLPDNIGALFADELHTQLAGGVTRQDIDALSARLNGSERCYYLNLDTLADELKLAGELLDKGGSRGVVLSGIRQRSAAADNKLYSQSGSELQPLGVAARAGEEITVYAQGIPAGESVKVYATQFNAEAADWIAGMGTLKNGRNVLTVPKIGSQSTERGGSLYFTYSGSAPEGISLHVRRAVNIPCLELSDWYSVSERERRERIGKYVDELYVYSGVISVNESDKTAKCLNVTELSLPGVLLSLPAAAVKNSLGQDRSQCVDTLYDSVLAWEDLMHICLTAQGIDGTYESCKMQTRQNIRCMQMFSGAFMYAAGSHIGIGYGSSGSMVCGSPISSLPKGADGNSLFGWGIAHEIGHNMDKLGKAEITNNIYSLMVQTYDGAANTLPSRLEKSGKYSGVFSKTAAGLAGASNDVFVQLGMYWQLHLAYDGADEPMGFYNSFFKAWKAGNYSGGLSGYDDRVALTASGVAGKDLTEFFQRWGMQLSSVVLERLKQYPREERAIWYLNDQSRRDAIAGVSRATGSIDLSAKPAGDNSVELSVAAEISGSVQGYEIIRNGSSIAFTQTGKYTDVIGSANNRACTYQAVAYDTLGNRVAESAAVEIRIAYDKTVDPALYEIERLDNGEIEIRFTEPAAVSGLKLARAPEEGVFTVTVTREGESSQAKTGSFADDNQSAGGDSFLCYFQKPGTESGDTRIWTYDVETVTISGVPGDIPLEEIRLISYPGDSVEFLSGCTAGVLQSDYRYGKDDGDVIEAGTLIITGAYRGDPLYGSVRIKGRFTTTDAEGETNTNERYLDGYCLLFAEIPADGAVSDISDGIFIFVPNVQREAELQDSSRCDGLNLLPSLIKAELWRSDSPNNTAGSRLTSDTLWTSAPGGDALPAILLSS